MNEKLGQRAEARARWQRITKRGPYGMLTKLANLRLRAFSSSDRAK